MKIKTSKGAAFTEYAVLAGLVGSVSLFVLLDFGNTATSTYTAQASVIEANLASAGLEVGGVLGDGGGGIYINTNEPPTGGGIYVNTNEPPPPPPPPVAYYHNWMESGSYRFPSGTSGPFMRGEVGVGPWASMTASGMNGIISGIGPANTAPEGGEPFSSSSGVTLNRTTTSSPALNTTFARHSIINLNFRVYDLDIGERVTIEGRTEDGITVFPTTSAPFIVSLGNGVFEGTETLPCAPSAPARCSARYFFNEPVVELNIYQWGISGAIQISDYGGFYQP